MKYNKGADRKFFLRAITTPALQNIAVPMGVSSVKKKKYDSAN
jgi:hypothetical protein